MNSNPKLEQLRKSLIDAEHRHSVTQFKSDQEMRMRYRQHEPGQYDDAVIDSSGIFVKPLLKSVSNGFQYKGNKNFVLFCFIQALQDSGYLYPFKEFLYDTCYMDLFCMNPATDIIEVEMKISRSDYMRDFIKTYRDGKHEGNKHCLLATGKAFANHFYFLMPAGMVHPSEIPDHAGLIVFKEYHTGTAPAVHFDVKRFAPLLHRDPPPADLYQVIADRLFNRIKSMDRKAAGAFHQYYRDSPCRSISL